jgi:DNA mismatch endonuclease, patch repair protein
MRRIRSTGNKSTELALMRLLRKKKIVGWRRHAKVLGIRPDFAFRKSKVAVFVDGCFWHACDLHCKFERLPPYWSKKVLLNWQRDHRQTTQLEHDGWKVVRVWEHDLKKGNENVLLPELAKLGR